MKKPVFYTEAAYGLGFCILALGTAMMSRGGFGISMVVAPAYILHLKLSQSLPFFSFGMAEYVFQSIVLALMMLLLRRARAGYLFTFFSSVIYGFLLDGCMALAGLLPDHHLAVRLMIYILGDLLCTAGIALLFYSYLPPAAYELFVKELSRIKGFPLSRCKTVYDCLSLVLALGMSLLFFSGIEGIGLGTVVCALVNGTLIRIFTNLLKGVWDFRDRFSLRRHFEEREEML